MPVTFRHVEKRRKELNKDLKGLHNADVSIGGTYDWRVGPNQYSISQVCRRLQINHRKAKRIIKELGITTYWYGRSEIILGRDFAILKIHLNK